MGLCVSRSPAPSAAGSEQAVAGTKTAKVIGLDGSMTQYAAPVTAREAMAADAARASTSFLCSADELRFDAPARAMAADEALHPGRLYFVLPAPMLRRPLSGQEMAALAVRASSALAGLALASPSRRKNGAGVSGANGKRMKATAQVAPALVVFSSSSDDEGERDDVGWSHHAHRKHGVPETVRKTRHGAGYRSRATGRHLGGVQRLSAILEAVDF